jgi:serine/threonine protein kinase
MDNGTIRELRRANGAYNIDIARRVSQQISLRRLVKLRQILEIGDGLAYLHCEGIIHGDLRGVRWEHPATRGFLLIRSASQTYWWMIRGTHVSQILV